MNILNKKLQLVFASEEDGAVDASVAVSEEL